MVAFLLNEYSGGTNVRTLAERLNELPTVIDVLLNELEGKNLLTVVRTQGDVSVFGISSLLRREID